MHLLKDLHALFIEAETNATDTVVHAFTEHLRLSGMYWGLTALHLMRRDLPGFSPPDVISFVLSCQHPCGAFGGNAGHDHNVLYTLSALQILALFGALDRVDATLIAHQVSSLQNSDGSFRGSDLTAEEVDSRLCYCALAVLALLGPVRTDPNDPAAPNVPALDLIDRAAAVSFILDCRNPDGGFGMIPSAESHGAQVFVCLASLAILGALPALPRPERTAFWLSCRQTPSGGLNGRPEKLPDVCYSWWALSGLHILHQWRLSLADAIASPPLVPLCDYAALIDAGKLTRFVYSAQDALDGGIADRPEDRPDIYHTFFGVAGLSLLQHARRMPGPAAPEARGMLSAPGEADTVPDDGLLEINPVFALPVGVCQAVGVAGWASQQRK
jgi:geranylgeranyl transferase type-2 subunit beta